MMTVCISELQIAISRTGRSIPHQNAASVTSDRYQWVDRYGFGVFRQGRFG